MVREDGLSQVEVAELLGRHKSWVCRRLALLEKLSAEVGQELEVGLLTPTAAREIARLPAGNQSEVMELSRREALSGRSSPAWSACSWPQQLLSRSHSC